jgi:4-amino-4-deoxy-L-arabinose transferase-like glycosyltransferase
MKTKGNYFSFLTASEPADGLKRTARLQVFMSSLLGEFSLLAGITLIAAVLRFYKLGTWSFWGDEIFSIGFREDGFNYNFLRQSLAGNLIHLATATLGTSEWSARLFPALIGIISIPILYFPTKRLFGTSVAILASGLLAVSPWHLYWSQNARFYSLLLLFYTLALLYFAIGIEEDRPWFLLLSATFLGLAAKERLVALFFIPVVLSHFFLLKVLSIDNPLRHRLRSILLPFTLGAVLSFFFVLPYARHLDQWLAAFGGPNNSPFWIVAGTVYYVGLPLVCIGAVGAVYFLLNRNRAVLLVSLSAAVPLVLMAGIALFQYTANRYIFMTLTSWILLAALAVRELFHHLKGHLRIFPVGLVLLLFMALIKEDFLYYQYQNGNRPDWKAALQFVQSHKEPGETVLTANRALGDYYSEEKTRALDAFGIDDIKESPVRVWIVDDWGSKDDVPDTMRWVEENAELIAVYDVWVEARNFSMRVYLYDPVRASSK